MYNLIYQTHHNNRAKIFNNEKQKTNLLIVINQAYQTPISPSTAIFYWLGDKKLSTGWHECCPVTMLKKYRYAVIGPGRRVPKSYFSSACVQWPAVTTVAPIPFQVHSTFCTCWQDWCQFLWVVLECGPLNIFSVVNLMFMLILMLINLLHNLIS